MDALLDSVHILSLLVFFCALITTTIFWLKLRHEKYWVGFPITFLFLTLHEIFEILHDAMGYNVEVFGEVAEIIGAIILTFSMYFLIKEISKIDGIEDIDDTVDE